MRPYVIVNIVTKLKNDVKISFQEIVIIKKIIIEYVRYLLKLILVLE